MIVDIVPMRRRHLRAVIGHERAAYPRAWSRSMYLSELAMRGTRAYVVALVGDSLVGHAGMMMNGTSGHVTTIVVSDDWRRRRIGARLLAQLTSEMIMRGGVEATLEVRESNRSAQALYIRFGYEPVGRRHNYYPETGEDAIIMTARQIDRDAYIASVREIVGDLVASTRVESSRPW